MIKEASMEEFTIENLARRIKQNVNIEFDILQDEIAKYIWPRLGFIIGSKEQKTYFIFEESYIETEWKDMISIHYLNTSYNVQSSVMRVHIFIRNEISNRGYVGFFTLRKIDEVSIMLSFIYPDWKKVKFFGKIPYVMTYPKKIHIEGRELVIDTYPLFAQDNITVACSQANIISMTKYLHNKFDMNTLRICDLNSLFSVGKTKLFPTGGINSQQMLEVFSNSGIPVYIKQIGWNTEDERIRGERIYRQYIEYSVESGIPVMIGGYVQNNDMTEKHVVQIIGHAKQSRMQYIIYDDSGCFIKSICGKKRFVHGLDWTELYEKIGYKNSFILFPLHEKVYLQYDDIKDIFELRCNESDKIRKLQHAGRLNIEDTRYLLVDNRIMKSFLQTLLHTDDLLDKEKEDINKSLSKNMPHYLWYCEIPLADEAGYMFFVADSTFWKKTTKDIFYINGIYCKQQLSLLQYSVNSKN